LLPQELVYVLAHEAAHALRQKRGRSGGRVAEPTLDERVFEHRLQRPELTADSLAEFVSGVRRPRPRQKVDTSALTRPSEAETGTHQPDIFDGLEEVELESRAENEVSDNLTRIQFTVPLNELTEDDLGLL